MEDITSTTTTTDSAISTVTVPQNHSNNSKTADVNLTLKDLSQVHICSEVYMSNCTSARNMSIVLYDIVSKFKVSSTSPNDLHLVTSLMDAILKSSDHSKDDGQEIFTKLIHVASKLLDTNRSIISQAQLNFQSSTKLIKNLEILSTTYLSKIWSANESNFNISTKNIAFIAVPVQEEDIYLTAVNTTSGVRIEPRSILSNEELASIKIPHEAVQKENSFVTSFYYGKDNLFLNNVQLKQLATGKDHQSNMVYNNVVFSASILNTSVENLTNHVLIQFKERQKTHQKTDCMFWDFYLESSTMNIPGGWSKRGCERDSSNKTAYINCRCNHLTNFALIMNVNQDFVNPFALTLTTWIGCSISIAGLVLTILTYLSLRRIRKMFACKVLISLCVSLLLTISCFLLGAEKTSLRFRCQLIAGIIQYFLLATFMWMAVEGYNLYIRFANSFKIAKSSTKDFCKASFFAWGLPLIIVSISAALSKESFGNENICVVNGKPFYFGVLLPSCIILLSNMLILRLSIVRMRTPKMILKVKERKEFQLVVTRFIICSTILGLTWATGVLAIGYARVVFHWLFCIFNSMQGFAIFICFVVFNKHVRVEIRRSFTTNLKEGCSSACVKEATWEMRKSVK